MTVPVEPDQAKLQEFMGRVIGYLTGAAAVYGMLLGDELGLYRGLVEAGPTSADALADKVGCNRRLVREWLDGQAAGKLVNYDAVTDSYSMSPEAAMALSDDSSPVFVARGMNGFATFFLDFEKIVAAFRSNGGLPWADHHPRLFAGTEWFFRTGYRAHLTTAWLPALEGVEASCQKRGACGRRHRLRTRRLHHRHGAMRSPTPSFMGLRFSRPSSIATRASAPPRRA